MMKTLTSALSIIALCVVCSRTAEYEGYTVYDIFPTKQQEPLLRSLFVHPGYDVWRTSPGERVTVMVDPTLKRDLLHILHKNGIKHSVYIENVASFRNFDEDELFFRDDSASLPPDLFSVYLSSQQMNNYLDLLAEKYPTLVDLVSFGTSFEKRRLDMIKISTGKSDTKKPIILIDAGIHAREWIAPAMALFIINQLVENKTNRYLTEDIEWHICPLLNPDGYEYSLKKDKWWRKTRSPTKSQNCRGVDANRNFDFHWNECGTSSDPCSYIYSGDKPFSEMETQAFRTYVMSIKNRLKLYLTFHSAGPFILYPWGYTTRVPLNAYKLRKIAESANEAQMKAGGPPYLIGSSTNVLYCASGGSDDWTMAIANVSLAYTIEMPPGTIFHFFPAPKQIRNYVTPMFEGVRTFGHHISGHQRSARSGSQREGHTNSNEWNFLKNRNYINTVCLLVIEFVLLCKA